MHSQSVHDPKSARDALAVFERALPLQEPDIPAASMKRRQTSALISPSEDGIVLSCGLCAAACSQWERVILGRGARRMIGYRIGSGHACLLTDVHATGLEFALQVDRGSFSAYVRNFCSGKLQDRS